MKKMNFLHIIVLAIPAALFAACAGAPQKAAPDRTAAVQADADAAAAIEAMQNGGGFPAAPDIGAESGGSGTASRTAGAGKSAAAAPAGGKQPAWVNKPEAVYKPAQYAAASGYGSSRTAAEINALGNLAGRFGMNVESVIEMRDTYSETKDGGGAKTGSRTDVDEKSRLENMLNTLFASKIAEYWSDGSTYYAAAVMDKAQARTLYADDIKTNLRTIDSLTSMSAAEKNTIDGYARYRQAALLADINENSGLVLKYIGSQGTGVDPASLKSGDDYRIEAAALVKNIPIVVKVDGDKNGRLAAAFTKALGTLGFRSAKQARYVLAATLAFEDADYPGQKNVFVRYNLDAVLQDTAGNTELFPFSDGGREGHVTRQQAENRALTTAEKKIAAEFPPAMEAWLDSIVPMKQ